MNRLRSPEDRFIDGLAKVSLLLGLFGLVSNLLQVVMVATMPVRPDQLLETLLGVPAPSAMRWMFEHLMSLSVIGVITSALFVYLCWALLRHREWARVVFIAMLALTAIANFATLAAVGPLFESMRQMMPANLHGTPEMTQIDAQLRAAELATLGMGLAGGLAVLALHGWLAYKLATPAIRDRFH